MGVCVVPFTRDGRVVLARLNRGCEIPGGGMEDADADFVATARREAWEETRIGLGELSLVQFVRIRRRDKSCSPSYAVIYAGMVTWMPRFVRRHESYGRVLVDPHELPHAVGFGTLADRKRLVAAARAAMACAGRVQAA
jgi:8-oxo-dGTP pyrophosphatase MutT (NUDIX family)